VPSSSAGRLLFRTQAAASATLAGGSTLRSRSTGREPETCKHRSTSGEVPGLSSPRGAFDSRTVHAPRAGLVIARG